MSFLNNMSFIKKEEEIKQELETLKEEKEILQKQKNYSNFCRILVKS